MCAPSTFQSTRNTCCTRLKWWNSWRKGRKAGSTSWLNRRRLTRHGFFRLIHASKKENCWGWRTCSLWETPSRSSSTLSSKIAWPSRPLVSSLTTLQGPCRTVAVNNGQEGQAMDNLLRTITLGSTHRACFRIWTMAMSAPLTPSFPSSYLALLLSSMPSHRQRVLAPLQATFCSLSGSYSSKLHSTTTKTSATLQCLSRKIKLSNSHRMR